MRSGIVAEKIGMSRRFLPNGDSIPVTLVKVFDCTVVEHKTEEKAGYNAVKLAYGSAKIKQVNKPMKGVYAKFGIEPAKGLIEFRVDPSEMLAIGDKINSSHFKEGSVIDVCGKSKGKGFAGAMKRHNFGGLRASHGVSITHRSHGSTGNRQDPGKVFKGKKMAGHLGDVFVTQQNLEVVYVDLESNVLGIKGAVPGCIGGLLFLRDAVKSAGK